MDSSIEKAIINTIESLASTTEDLLLTEVHSNHIKLGVVIKNLSDYSFSVRTFEPYHGSYGKFPAATLAGIKEVEGVFEKYINEPVNLNYSISNNLKLWLDTPGGKSSLASTVLDYSGASQGMGFETLIALENKEPNKYHVIAILVTKMPGSSFGCGVFSSQQEGFFNFAADIWGTGIIDNIKQMQYYSDGQGPKTMDSNGLKVAFSAPNEIIQITISNS